MRLSCLPFSQSLFFHFLSLDLCHFLTPPRSLDLIIINFCWHFFSISYNFCAKVNHFRCFSRVIVDFVYFCNLSCFYTWGKSDSQSDLKCWITSNYQLNSLSQYLIGKALMILKESFSLFHLIFYFLLPPFPATFFFNPILVIFSLVVSFIVASLSRLYHRLCNRPLSSAHSQCQVALITFALRISNYQPQLANSAICSFDPKLQVF